MAARRQRFMEALPYEAARVPTAPIWSAACYHLPKRPEVVLRDATARSRLTSRGSQFMSIVIADHHDARIRVGTRDLLRCPVAIHR
jgi:hypothetical protein